MGVISRAGDTELFRVFGEAVRAKEETDESLRKSGARSECAGDLAAGKRRWLTSLLPRGRVRSSANSC